MTDTDIRHQLKPQELAVLEMRPIFKSDLFCEYRDHMGNDDSLIEAMLVSTKQDEELLEALRAVGLDHTVSETPEQYAKSRKPRLDFMMKHRHGSPFEQAAMKFYIKAPIMVFREWHRHRIGFSYNEASARYKVMPPLFYIPGPERPIVQVGKHSSSEWVAGTPEQYERQRKRKIRAYSLAWEMYVEGILDGEAKETARLVLGVGLYSEMVTTLNPRSCMAFLSLRQHQPEAMFVSRPQWEINQCANQMEETFKQLFPLTHDVYVANGRVAP